MRSNLSKILCPRSLSIGFGILGSNASERTCIDETHVAVGYPINYTHCLSNFGINKKFAFVVNCSGGTKGGLKNLQYIFYYKQGAFRAKTRHVSGI